MHDVMGPIFIPLTIITKRQTGPYHTDSMGGWGGGGVTGQMLAATFQTLQHKMTTFFSQATLAATEAIGTNIFMCASLCLQKDTLSCINHSMTCVINF